METCKILVDSLLPDPKGRPPGPDSWVPQRGRDKKNPETPAETADMVTFV